MLFLMVQIQNNEQFYHTLLPFAKAAGILKLEYLYVCPSVGHKV